MKQQEFKRRRSSLMKLMGKGTIAVVPSATTKVRNSDVTYPFRQDSDFLYLTGFNEPDSVAVLCPGRRQGDFVMFCRDRDPARETWNGRRYGPEGVINEFGASDAFPIDDIDEILPGLIESCDSIYYTMGVFPDFDRRMIGWLNELRAKARGGIRTPEEIVALDHLLHDLRLFKSQAEIRTMRQAARVSVNAHKEAMLKASPGLYEYQLHALLAGEFQAAGGCEAYGSIVGSGKNACILHYVENNRQIEDGELVLIDAGCELEGYASDITRTFPANGKFSPEQRAIYQLVLDAQKAAIKKCSPGKRFNEAHDITVRIITRGLVKLGLLKGDTETLIKQRAYQKFYMHRAGHWLGLDVHDVGDYKISGQWRTLEPGMVLTVEPGIYVAPGTRGVNKKWWGIGVRIEDDVLVSKAGPDVLTDRLIKEPDDIEAWMRHAA